jgi:hypothetical protein
METALEPKLPKEYPIDCSDDEFARYVADDIASCVEYLDGKVKKIVEDLVRQALVRTPARVTREEVQKISRDACSTVISLADALSENDETCKPNTEFWKCKSLAEVRNPPREWGICSPIGQVSLKSAVHFYLRFPSFRHPFIDWALINAALFDEYVHYRDHVRSLRGIGLTLPYLLGDGSTYKTLGIAFIGRMVMWGGLTFLAYYFNSIFLGFFAAIVVIEGASSMTTKALLAKRLLDKMREAWLASCSATIDLPQLRALVAGGKYMEFLDAILGTAHGYHGTNLAPCIGPS